MKSNGLNDNRPQEGKRVPDDVLWGGGQNYQILFLHGIFSRTIQPVINNSVN